MHKEMKLLVFIGVIVLTGVACTTLYEFNCAAKGGVWVEGGWEGDIRTFAHCDESDDDDRVENSSESQVDNDAPDAVEENAQEQEPAASQHAPLEMAEPEECIASQYLYIQYSEPEVKDDKNENRCKYSITYTNTGDQQIWVFLHKRSKNAETKIEDVWKNYYSLDPGESLEESYRTLLYKEAGTTWIDVVIDVAPITATEACKNTFRHDTAPRAQIGYPVKVPCSLP